jgi:hypothetical protein
MSVGDALKLPARAEIGRGEIRFAAVHIGVVEAAVLGGEELARGKEFLLRQQRRHQARQRAAALVEFHRRRAPCGERAGGLAAGEPKGARHGVGVEFQQRPDRRRRTERTKNAGAVPTAGAEFWIIGADTDPRRHLASRGDRGEQRAPAQSVALGNGQRRRHDLRRDVRHGLAMHVAHGDRGDEIGVERSRAGKRQMLAADHARFRALRQARCQRRDLSGLLAEPAGDRAGQRIEQQRLAVLASARRNVLVA